MTRKEILAEAERCVCTNRENEYGSPENNFAKIADLWNAYCGFNEWGFDSKDVAAMLVLLKVARVNSGHAKADNWVDIAGYAACGGEIETGVE